MGNSYEQYPDRISKCFENKTVLVTGATGFVGKVLLEKMLRTCEGVEKIYVLIRNKKEEKEPDVRLGEIFKDPIFESLKNSAKSSVLNKVEAVSGDVAAPDLDLTLSDRTKLCKEVEIIYHCAAVVRFDITLQEAVFTNVRGTKLVLELAKNCEKLQVLVHVSTAFCHLDEEVLLEKTYPPPCDPNRIINVCENLEEDLVEKIKSEILGKFPNCYPFTKALAEGLVSDVMGEVPVVIFRPSVVVPIWQEPLPGYTDNINGPTGLLICAGKGILKTLFCNPEGYLDYIPADIVANGLLFSTFDYITNNGTRNVYNAVSSTKYKITTAEIVKMGNGIIETTLPFNNILWYPGGQLTQSKIKHFFVLILFQLFPAFLIDAVLILFRMKPFFLKIQKRIFTTSKLLEYYVNRNWNFDNSETLKAIENLNIRERQIYKLDGDGGVFRNYFLDCIHAARLYILKESDEQIPMARLQMKIMWVVDFLARIFIVSAIFYYVAINFFYNK